MKFIAKVEQLRPILKWIREQLAHMKFDQAKLKQIELASEEALVNIIHHAYQGRAEDIEIEVHATLKNCAEIIFKDHGPPFNPLEAKEVNLFAQLEEREIGGLGIPFIRQLVDEVRYSREGNLNVLVLVKI